MYQNYSISEKSTFFQKLRSLDYILLFSVLTIGLIGIFAMFFGCALIVYGFISAMKFAGSTMGDDEDDDEDGDGGDEAIAIARAPLL